MRRVTPSSLTCEARSRVLTNRHAWAHPSVPFRNLRGRVGYVLVKFSRLVCELACSRRISGYQDFIDLFLEKHELPLEIWSSPLSPYFSSKFDRNRVLSLHDKMKSLREAETTLSSRGWTFLTLTETLFVAYRAYRGTAGNYMFHYHNRRRLRADKPLPRWMRKRVQRLIMTMPRSGQKIAPPVCNWFNFARRGAFAGSSIFPAVYPAIIRTWKYGLVVKRRLFEARRRVSTNTGRQINWQSIEPRQCVIHFETRYRVLKLPRRILLERHASRTRQIGDDVVVALNFAEEYLSRRYLLGTSQTSKSPQRGRKTRDAG